MGTAELLATTFAVVLAAFFVLWLLSLRLRDASIVDICWGPGFAAIALLAFLLAEAGHAGITVLTLVWGLRLGWYLAWRNAGAGEDPRYQAMRRQHGERFGRVSLFTVFGLQAVLMWFVSLPVQVAQTAQAARVAAPSEALGVLETVGVVLWCVGIFFESVGDWQLARFKADPANATRVMDRGLWRYTRHPNYFGDCCVWWGLFAVAVSATPTALLTVLSPVLMTVFLLKVSGVALLERTIGKRRPDYADYVRRTSSFIPLPPRR